jgi:hypothetical protein
MPFNCVRILSFLYFVVLGAVNETNRVDKLYVSKFSGFGGNFEAK